MKIGTRDSELAIRQTEIFIDVFSAVYPDEKIEIIPIRSSGDIDLTSPLDKFGGFGVFVKELDAALREGRIDVAVNSMKDIPIDIPHDLCIPAVLKRADVRDVCIPCAIEDLEEGAIVGTSSIRRATILKRIRSDLKTEILRGNIKTRLSKLDSGQYDAIILAKAGIDRLGIKRRMVVLDPTVFVPSPAQGAIAIVCRTSDKQTIKMVSAVNDRETRFEVDAERYLMKLMGAGCSSPIGINARHRGEMLSLNAVSFNSGVKTSFSGLIPVRVDFHLMNDVVRILNGDKLGHIYIVGAGPGDRDLITVKGLDLLRSAQVVVYDALADQSLLDECPNAEKINVGKRSNRHVKTQSETNQLLVDLGKSGNIVVRLKGGDPFLFGRGAEEASVLKKAGVPVTVVPGVSSSIAIPEITGIPVTHRDHASCVTILTGHSKEYGDGIDWKSVAKFSGTLVILMGMTNAGDISTGLINGGKSPDTEVAVITDGARNEQHTEITVLSNLKRMIVEKKLEAPGIIVIGSVVSVRDELGDIF
ncbi:MAG: hydroxymethylbilane synthase [archaeon]|nr:hydroxymethylbilane synthase [archaeon]